jgi:hypothetical protein
VAPCPPICCPSRFPLSDIVPDIQPRGTSPCAPRWNCL